MLKLLIGVKRSCFRENDPRRGRADAEFTAKRPSVLVKQKFTCAGCKYQALQGQGAHMDVHHADDDHHNNRDENLVLACHLCHPYQHVGEIARRTDIGGEGLGKLTLIATIPEISAADLNLLQRAIGAAMLDEKEAPIAMQMYRALESRAILTAADFGSNKAPDFAAALRRLTDDEYVHREEAIADQRVLFNEIHLRKVGTQLRADYPTMPLESWAEIASGVSRKAPPQSVGA